MAAGYAFDLFSILTITVMCTQFDHFAIGRSVKSQHQCRVVVVKQEGASKTLAKANQSRRSSFSPSYDPRIYDAIF